MSNLDLNLTLPRGPHNLSREQVAETQRLRLLAAMINTVAAKGYANTAVADVLAGSNISRATFYSMFKDKDDCFRAAFELAATQVSTLMASGLRGVTTAPAEARQDPLGLLDMALTAYLNALGNQPALARLFLVEVYAAGPAAIAQRQRSLEVFVDVIAGIFRGRLEKFGGPDEQRFVIKVIVNAMSSLVTNLAGTDQLDKLMELKAPLLKLATRLLRDG